MFHNDICTLIIHAPTYMFLWKRLLRSAGELEKENLQKIKVSDFPSLPSYPTCMDHPVIDISEAIAINIDRRGIQPVHGLMADIEKAWLVQAQCRRILLPSL